MKRIARSAIVAHDPAALYALVENVESYPSFLPWCLDVQVHERGPTRTVATVTLGLRGLRQAITTDNVNVPGERIDMSLVRGPFRRFSAHWTFAPLGPAATRIEFVMAYEFTNRLVARALEPLFRHVADSMVDAFCRRADAVLGHAAR